VEELKNIDGKMSEKMPLGMLRLRWKDDIKIDPEDTNLIDLTQHRVQYF
jgi:hypothetical protein